VPLVAVLLLQLAQELVLLAADERPVVVRQLAPLRLQLAGELLPVALNLIPVHDVPPAGSFIDRAAVVWPPHAGGLGGTVTGAASVAHGVPVRRIPPRHGRGLPPPARRVC